MSRKRSTMEASRGCASVRATCRAGTVPKAFGRASSAPMATMPITRAYIHAGYRFMADQRDLKVAEEWIRRSAGALHRALGEHGADGLSLYLELDAVGNLDRQELLVHRRDLAEDAAGGHHLVAGGQLGDHFPVLLLALLLRADEQEVESREQDDHRQQEPERALLGRRALRPGTFNQEIHIDTVIAGDTARYYSTSAGSVVPCRARNSAAKASKVSASSAPRMSLISRW